jgi:hypothetical protein
VIDAGGQLTLNVGGGKQPTTSTLRLVGGKIEVDGQYAKGETIVVRIEAVVNEIGFKDQEDSKTGQVVGCERRHRRGSRGSRSSDRFLVRVGALGRCTSVLSSQERGPSLRGRPVLVPGSKHHKRAHEPEGWMEDSERSGARCDGTGAVTVSRDLKKPAETRYCPSCEPAREALRSSAWCSRDGQVARVSGAAGRPVGRVCVDPGGPGEGRPGGAAERFGVGADGCGVRFAGFGGCAARVGAVERPARVDVGCVGGGDGPPAERPRRDVTAESLLWAMLGVSGFHVFRLGDWEGSDGASVAARVGSCAVRGDDPGARLGSDLRCARGRTATVGVSARGPGERGVGTDRDRRQVSALSAFPVEPTLVLREGGTCRHTAFWAVRKPLDPDDSRKVCKHLAHALRTPKKYGDSMWFAPPGCVIRTKARPVPVVVAHQSRGAVLDAAARAAPPEDDS